MSGIDQPELLRAFDVKIGMYVMIKGEPCKVVEQKVSKSGKHGNAKVHITGLHVFTNKKYGTVAAATEDMEVHYLRSGAQP